VYLSGASALLGFSLPLNAAGNPAVSFGGGGAKGIAFDTTGHLFAAAGETFRGIVDIYSQPITAASTPSAALFLPAVSCSPSYRCGGATDMASDTAGHLFVTATSWSSICGPRGGCGAVQRGVLYVFVSPFTRTSTPTATVSLNAPLEGVGVDRGGIVWTSKQGGELIGWTPPYSNRHSFIVGANARGGIAFDASGNMYVAASDGIDVYRPPFSTSMVKSFAVNAGLPNFLAFDSSGNLYVTTTTGTGIHVLVFTPPLTSASAPVLSLALPAQGIVVGP
jgi:sugar lactone lactonase YvrE